tara:strand:- start:3775 stop:5970 length:2196 start_codon:yes stop_codon:yes gene_type:complete
MFKNFLKIFSLLFIIVILLISYLSIFGIKTSKFNDLIKSEIIKKDKRLRVDINEVFIKLNIKQGSFYLNSKDINLLIRDEQQKVANVDIYVHLSSIITKGSKIKKIVLNSKENEILSLLKFIRAYKINIPALYLENYITKGSIIYNVVVDFVNKSEPIIKLSGKIFNAELNILNKKIINNIDLKFSYNDFKLKIINLNLKYNNSNFYSENISVEIKKNSMNVKGDLKNKINSKLIKNLTGLKINRYLDEKIFLSTKSLFEINLSKKFKIKDYKLESKININDIIINIDNLELEDYISEFENKIYFKDGELVLFFSKNKINANLNSKYLLNENNKPKKIFLNYSKEKKFEKYELKLDLFENELKLDKVNFVKKKNEDFFLNLIAYKNKNFYEIKNLTLFNDKNKFFLKNLKLLKNFKINNFSSFEGNYYNKEGYFNDISIKKNNNKITLNSNSFDISSNIEKSLKGKSKHKVFDIFENLNSNVNINIKSVKIDDDHSLKNLKGEVMIIENVIDKANLLGKFDNENYFTYTIKELDGKKVTTIFSDIAKPFVKKFKFIKGFEDGKLDYTSTKINKNLSNSELRIYNFKLQNMPALTKLLSLASLQGIADLATGQGIRFNEFEMLFENTKNLITINEIYALGPAISILMEGYVEKNKLVSLRGTLVPATTINKTIAKIPVIGEILVGDNVGEGVFGVSFKIKGPPGKLDTRVNPIKTLTPRFITRTLKKIKNSN